MVLRATDIDRFQSPRPLQPLTGASVRAYLQPARVAEVAPAVAPQ